MPAQAHDTEEAELLHALGASVGLPGFGPAALALLAATVTRDMEWVLVYARRGAPRVLHHRVVAEAGSGIDHARIRELYDGGYFRFDPFYRYWREGGAPGLATLRQAAGSGTGDRGYMTEFMPITGVADDVALMLELDGDHALALCLERRRPYSAAELARIAAHEPLLAGLAMSHGRYQSGAGKAAAQGQAPLDFEAAIAAFQPGLLTAREREIVRLALSGLANEAIARRLSVTVGTVKNHRKRIHAKLDITSERELFSLFLGHLAGLDPSAFTPA